MEEISERSTWSVECKKLNNNFAELDSLVSNDKGIFSTDTALKNAYPAASNKKGFFAFVGTQNPFRKWEVQADARQWIDTGEDINIADIDLTQYSKKSDVQTDVNDSTNPVASNAVLKEINKTLIANTISNYPFTLDSARQYPDVPKAVTDIKITTKDYTDDVYLSGIIINTGSLSLLYIKKGSGNESDPVIAHIVDLIPLKTIGSITYFKLDQYVNSGYEGYIGIDLSIDINKTSNSIKLPLLKECFDADFKDQYNVSQLSDDVSGLEKDVAGLKTFTVDYDLWSRYVTLPGFMGKNGEIANYTDPNWNRSDFIPFPENTEIDIRCLGHNAINSISFYTTNKYTDFTSGDGAASQTTYEKKITSPEGTKYIILSGGSDTYPVAESSKPFRATYKRDLIKDINNTEESISEINNTILKNSLSYIPKKQLKIILLPDDTIELFGDSNSSTDYIWYKNTMQDFTGATVRNDGISGATTAQLASNASLQRIFDANPKLIIALVGGNDTGAPGTVGTFSGIIEGEPIVHETDITQDYNGTTFIQAVSHIMRKVNAYYYNIRERANLTGNETEAEKEAKIDAVIKPYFVFCTPLPQKRNNASDPFSQPENWERKANAVRECCMLYGVHCIDVLKLIGIDMTKEPYWVGPTDMNTNNGVYTMDGLHLNKYGCEVKYVPLLCGEIGLG